MGWKIRARGENVYHHIYAWGNDRHPVFKEPKHYRKYLILLEKYATSFKIDVIAYALMKSHVHLFLYDKLSNISEFMMKLHGDYAQFYNKVNERVGHVFGERFNNKIVSANIYGKWLSRYIHRQAVEAGLVENPADYPWTSYCIYIGKEKKKFLKSEVILTQFGNGEERLRIYQEFVLNNDDGPLDWSGRVLKLVARGDFISHVCRELKVDRSVLLNPHGADERQIRHQAVKLLVENYGYKPAHVAHALGLSRASITNILR
jgi:putative transposase